MYEKRLSDLKNQVAIQCSDGNWNYCPYMHGMANGLILALATMTDTEPKFKDAPDVWLRDLPDAAPMIKGLFGDSE